MYHLPLVCLRIILFVHTWLLYTGCTVQKGELRRYRFEISTSVQCMNSIRWPLVIFSLPLRCTVHHGAPLPSIVPHASSFDVTCSGKLFRSQGTKLNYLNFSFGEVFVELRAKYCEGIQLRKQIAFLLKLARTVTLTKCSP